MTIPYITPTQQKIPQQIYRFRFLDRKQIQKILNHKHHKRIIDWLNDLVEKEYLEKVSKYNTFEARTKPTIYRIGINGIRFLKTLEGCSEEIIKKLYKDKNRSEAFISASQFLADIYLDLKSQRKDNVSYEIITNSDFVSADSSFHFLTELNPNLIYKEIKEHKKRKTSKYFLVEIFETTLPRFSIRKRMRTYLEFYLSNQWEDNINIPFPILKFICPTKADLIYTKRYAKKLLEENQNPTDLHVQFATVGEIQKQGFTSTPWEEVE